METTRSSEKPKPKKNQKMKVVKSLPTLTPEEKAKVIEHPFRRLIGSHVLVECGNNVAYAAVVDKVYEGHFDIIFTYGLIKQFYVPQDKVIPMALLQKNSLISIVDAANSGLVDVTFLHTNVEVKDIFGHYNKTFLVRVNGILERHNWERIAVNNFDQLMAYYLAPRTKTQVYSV